MLGEFFSAEKRSEQAVESMNKTLERQTELYDEQTGALEQSIKVRKLQAEIEGASAKELLEIDRKALKERQALNEQFIATQLANMDKLRNDSNISQEDYQKQQDKLNDNLNKGLAKRLELQRGGTIAELESQKKQHEDSDRLKEDANNKANALAEKAKADLLQQKQALKSLEQKYQDDIENMQDTTAQKKLDRQKERALEELDKIKLSETAKLEAIRLINEDFKLKQEALDKAQDDKLLSMANKFAKDKEDLLAKTDEDKLNLKIKRDTEALEIELATMVGDDAKKNELRRQLDDNNDILVKELAQKRLDEKNALKQEQLIKDSEDEKLTFEARLLALQEQDRLIDENTALTAEQRIEAHKKNKDATDKINKDEVASEKAKQEAKKQLAMLGVDILKTATGLLFGEGKKAQDIQKALTLTQIGIDTASAFSKLMAGSEAAAVATGPAYPVSKPIFYATGVLQILGNIAKAKQALSSADSGGGSVSASGGGGGAVSAGAITPPPAPTFNVVGPSGANQIAQSIAGQDQQPLKAYVVGGDVTTQQSLNRNIVSNASIG
jgi:hypothetical protein